MSDHKRDEELLNEVCRAQRNEAYAESAFDKLGARRAGDELVQARAELLAHIGELRASLPAAEVQTWLPISEAPKDGSPVLLFSEGFIDDDFNPAGCIDGHWLDDHGWQGAMWNGYTDQWDTREVVPTHFRPQPLPPSTERNPS